MSQGLATIWVEGSGFLSLRLPDLQIGMDSLRLMLEVHADPVSQLTSRGADVPLTVVRGDPDSVLVAVSEDLLPNPWNVDALNVQSVSVLHGRSRNTAPGTSIGERTYGASALGGVILITLNHRPPTRR
jgi:hypothetical protein